MKRFGFGMMRLPMLGDEVDKAQVCQMVDEFLAAGFTYFDTAHGYLDGKSELAIRDCLASRHPRESFVLANKLSAGLFKTREEVLPYFENQLRCCGVEYFDYYLIHAMAADRYDFYKDTGAFEIIPQLRSEGRVRPLRHVLPRQGRSAGPHPRPAPGAGVRAAAIQLPGLRGPRCREPQVL